MADWKDANIRNHISGDKPQLTFSNFFEQFNFVNEASRQYYPFILKDSNFSSADIVYNIINSENLDNHISNLKDKSPRYSFASTSNNKPMQDAFFAFGNVYLYQLILKMNGIWNLMEYTDSSMKKVLIPNKSLLQILLKELLVGSYFKMTKELNNPDELEEAINNVIIKADEDIGLNDILSDKLFIEDINEVKKRMDSPLVSKYLSKELNKIVNKENSISEESLKEILTDIISKIRHYVYDN